MSHVDETSVSGIHWEMEVRAGKDALTQHVSHGNVYISSSPTGSSFVCPWGILEGHLWRMD